MARVNLKQNGWIKEKFVYLNARLLSEDPTSSAALTSSSLILVEEFIRGRLVLYVLAALTPLLVPGEDVGLVSGWFLQLLAMKDELCHLVELLDAASRHLGQTADSRQVDNLQRGRRTTKQRHQTCSGSDG